MKIYFINSRRENCGVYQYGLRIWDALKESKLDVTYHEIETTEQFYKLDLNSVDILFFNWIEGGAEGPFGWYQHPTVMDIKNNYIRFVEDDWENPSVGAAGLGWEVWFNGMEISQFTYMQQVGGIECEVISGEITYGLERIAMHIQNVDSIFEINWNGLEGDKKISYGDIFKQSEIENSAFILEHSNIKTLFKNFAENKNQSEFLAQKNLPIPAYEQALKASHVLNLLDARGAISVNERASYIAQIRGLVKAACELVLLKG
jgi:tetrameric-type glycyl-tRNA synthetase alpha subunit